MFIISPYISNRPTRKIFHLHVHKFFFFRVLIIMHDYIRNFILFLFFILISYRFFLWYTMVHKLFDNWVFLEFMRPTENRIFLFLILYILTETINQESWYKMKKLERSLLIIVLRSDFLNKFLTHLLNNTLVLSLGFRRSQILENCEQNKLSYRYVFYYLYIL